MYTHTHTPGIKSVLIAFRYPGDWLKCYRKSPSCKNDGQQHVYCGTLSFGTQTCDDHFDYLNPHSSNIAIISVRKSFLNEIQHLGIFTILSGIFDQ